MHTMNELLQGLGELDRAKWFFKVNELGQIRSFRQIPDRPGFLLLFSPFTALLYEQGLGYYHPDHWASPAIKYGIPHQIAEEIYDASEKPAHPLRASVLNAVGILTTTTKEHLKE